MVSLERVGGVLAGRSAMPLRLEVLERRVAMSVPEPPSTRLTTFFTASEYWRAPPMSLVLPVDLRV